jgi:glutathione S-transferase
MITLCGFGLSNHCNKLNFFMLEKNLPFQERLMYPWQRETFRASSPLGKIPYSVTEHGSLSESQVILEIAAGEQCLEQGCTLVTGHIGK